MPKLHRAGCKRLLLLLWSTLRSKKVTDWMWQQLMGTFFPGRRILVAPCSLSMWESSSCVPDAAMPCRDWSVVESRPLNVQLLLLQSPTLTSRKPPPLLDHPSTSGSVIVFGHRSLVILPETKEKEQCHQITTESDASAEDWGRFSWEVQVLDINWESFVGQPLIGQNHL